MPTFLPGPAPQCFRGEYVVMPAHSSGEAAALSRLPGTFSTKSSVTVMPVE
jgi:hypothetical protein